MRFFSFLLGFSLTLSIFPVSLAASTSDEQVCYQLARNMAGEIPLGSELLAATPTQLDTSSGFVDSKIGESVLPHIRFNEPLFRTKIYSFGEQFPFTRNDLSKTNEILNLDNPDFVDDDVHQFEFVSFFDADDDELLGCKLTVREPEGGLSVSQVTPDKFVGQTKPINIYKFDDELEQDGKKYKAVVYDKAKMDLSYTDPVFTQYSIAVIPEVDRTDFDAYSLVDTFVDQTNGFYSYWLPRAAEKVEFRMSDPARDVTKVPLYQTDDLLIEIYKEIKSDGDRGDLTVSAIPVKEFNGDMNCLYNYLPFYRDAIAEKMLELGLTDVANIWLTHKQSDYRSDLANLVIGNDSIDVENLDASEVDSILAIDLEDQFGNFLRESTIRGEQSGVDDPNKTDEVQLFWRLKERIDAGMSEEDFKEFIAEYPEYLQLVATAQRKMHAVEMMENMTDIDKESWYADFIEELMGWGVIDGYEDGTYRPSDPVNRAEMAKIVVTLFALPVPDTVDANPFPDVPADSWYAPYVSAAKDAGVIAGYPDGYYRPANPVNRAEAMKMLLGASGAEIVAPTRTSFSDVSPQAWFGPFVNFANLQNVVSGYSDGTFKPGQTVNRAEIAKMAARARQEFMETEAE